MTLFQLVKSTETFRARQYKSGKVLSVKVKYVHWNKQLYIQGEVKSGTERNKTYKVQIVFNGIQSSPKRTRQHTLKYIDIDGSTIWIERADPKKHTVLTRCSNCPDFRFVGHWYIADKKALLGPRIPYTKVPGSNRPSVNPCLVGSTKIKLLDGTIKTIEEMTNEYNKDQNSEFWVYSFDHDSNRIVPAKALFPRKTKEVSELIEITLDSGEKEYSTVEHLFLDRSGNYIEAQNLTEGTSMMPFYYKYNSDDDEISKNTSIRGYEIIKQPLGDWEFTHRLVSSHCKIRDWSNGEYKQVRHHIDFNKKNNNPTNIAWMSMKQHHRLHRQKSGWGWKCGRQVTDSHREQARSAMLRLRDKHYNPNNPEYNSEESIAYRESMSKSARERLKKCWSNPEFYKQNVDKVREMAYNTKVWEHPDSIKTRFGQSKEHTDRARAIQWSNPERRKSASEYMSKNISKWWDEHREEELKRRSSTEGKISYQRKRVVNLAKKLVSLGYTLSEESWDRVMETYKQDYNVHHTGLRWKNTIEEYFENGVSDVLREISYNHKVVSVKKIQLDSPVPVYDLTVPVYENFALVSGIFSHNCKIPTLCKHQLELLKRLMSGRVRLVKRDPYIVSYLNRPKRVSK